MARNETPMVPPALGEPPVYLAERMGFLLARGHLDALSLALEVLEPGMTPKHFGVLRVVAEEGPLSQQGVGDRMRVDRTTMIAIIDELERRELLERHRDPADRRKYALEITDAGRRWMEQTEAALDAAEQRFLAHLEPDERDELLRLLRKLVFREA